MPTRKITELPRPCASPDHKPPMHMYFENGVYEHTCSACGHKTVFTVNHPTLYWGYD